jgi:hypothetical protein
MQRYFGLRPTSGPITLALCVLMLGAVLIWALNNWWHLHKQASEARARALPTCIATLSQEDAFKGPLAEPECKARIDKNFEDCLVVARHSPGRYSGGTTVLIQEQLDECILLSAEVVLQRRSDERSRQARQRTLP